MALRLNLIIVGLLAFSHIALAQHRGPVPLPLPTGRIPPILGPLPTGSIPQRLPPAIGRPIGVTRGPLPRIGLPLPPLGLPAAGVNHGFDGRNFRDGFGDRGFGGFVRPALGGGYWPGAYWPGVVYGIPDASYYPPTYEYSQPSSSPAYTSSAPGNMVMEIRSEPNLSRGYLLLNVRPGNADVFVDGYYVGSSDDLLSRGGELPLEPGPHSVKIDAAGYEPVGFDVKITANDSISYRRELKALNGTRPQPPATAPQKPKTFYLIPGCYMGDVPPKDAALPASCDLSRLVTFTP